MNTIAVETLQTAAPVQRHSLGSSNRSAREIARLFSDGSGDTSPKYQRGSIWSDGQRRLLVKSWLSGVPVPAIIINDRLFGPWPDGEDGLPAGGFLYAAIDGKQRIETAIAWFSGDLAVPASWFPAEVIEVTEDTNDGPYVRHTGLILPEQRHQGVSFHLPTVEAKVATIQEEAALYLLVNGAGTAQTVEDLLNAEGVVNS